MTFLELAKTRYSVRNYEAKAVEEEKLQQKGLFKRTLMNPPTKINLQGLRRP
jgi:nitroreductase